MDKIKTYKDEGKITTDDEWVSNEVYKEALKKTVVACADVVITLEDSRNTIYLARRNVNPQKGLWFLDGRIKFNSKDIPNALVNNLERETKCRFDSNRFTFVTVNDYKFDKCAQGNFPVRSLAVLYRINVTEQELESLSSGLASSEYEKDFGLKPFARDDLVKEQVHSAVLDAFDLIWGR